LLPPDAILGSICSQNAFAALLYPGPWGAYSAPPDPLAVFDGAASRLGRGRRGLEGRGRMGGKGNGPSQL